MRRNLAVELPAGTLLDDVHLPLAAFFRGYRVILDETAKAYDFPTSLNAEFRRKVRTQAGMYQIMRSFPALLHPITVCGSTLSRINSGGCAAGGSARRAGASLFLPWPYSVVAVSAQVAFYGLAALDTILPERAPLKRLSSPIRTFVVLMAAAFCAPSILFLPQTLFWSRTEVRQTKVT